MSESRSKRLARFVLRMCPILRAEGSCSAGVEAADAGVIDENVDAPERAIDAGGGVLHLMELGDVAGNHFGFASGGDDGTGRLIEGGMGASAKNRSSAQGGKAAGDGGADSAPGSGNHCDLPDKRLPGVHMNSISLADVAKR